MIALNPYRLRHKMREGHRGAQKTSRLLRRKDRLLGVILIGTNLVNNSLAIVAGMICYRWFGEIGYSIAAVGLTLLMLIFAEVAPKRIAATRPESIAFPASYVIDPLHKVLHPVERVVNFMANWLVNPFVKRTTDAGMALTSAELRQAVNENAAIHDHEQAMLLGILDLAELKIDDVMIGRSDVVGIDLQNDDREIIEDLVHAPHTRVPVYDGSIDNVKGILHLRRSGRLLNVDDFDLEQLIEHMDEPYFVPSKTPLSTQLINFQQRRERIAMVVDEYGEIEGILTLEDILEEIVGEFTTNVTSAIEEIFPQQDGSYLITGTALLREINNKLDWNLPTDGPRTLNGLLLERLEGFPDGNVTIKVENYVLETRQVRDNAIKTVHAVKLPDPPSDENDLEDESAFES